MKEILTKEKRLRIFEDGILVDKKLLKWRNAERGLQKTQPPKSTLSTSESTITSNVPRQEVYTYSDHLNRAIDVDYDINSSTKWIDLYDIDGSVNFDKLALLGIQDLNRLIVENKLKYVIGGYGSFGDTQRLSVITNESYNNTNKRSIFNLICDWVYEKYKKLKYKQSIEFDVLEFFNKVKLSSKNSICTYRNRVQDYLIAIHNAIRSGQVALVEELARGMVVNKYEAVLESEGFYHAITEKQLVSFLLKTEKGVKLNYIKNFTRPLPIEICEKIEKLNQLEIFDNYVVLYYDVNGEIYKETEKEKVKRKDPILFGVIAGSTKLYYVDDWVDEYCDLTLEKFLDVAKLTKNDVKLNNKIILNNNNFSEKKKKKRYNNKKNKTTV
jgi:hypothetical protein